MGKLSGKNALVTGGSRGIGRAICERLAADGANLAVHYGTNEAAAEQTVEAIKAHGGTAFSVRAELGVPGEVDALFDAVSSGFAGGPLHVLVNNVGVGGQTARSSRPPTNSSTASSP